MPLQDSAQAGAIRIAPMPGLQQEAVVAQWDETMWTENAAWGSRRVSRGKGRPKGRG